MSSSSSSTTASVAIVTTHGATRYVPVSLSSTTEAQVLHPAQANARTVVMHVPNASSSVTVCRASIRDIEPMLVVQHELVRDAHGNFKHVRLHTDTGCYDVHYQNAELRRSIPLGRYSDPATASLAHALARSNDAHPSFRSVPYAVQAHIQTLVRARADTAKAQTPSDPPHASPEDFGNQNCLDDDDGLTLDDLLEL